MKVTVKGTPMGYTVVLDDFKFKEDWLLKAYNFIDSESTSPSRDYIKRLDELYSTVTIHREYYVNTKSQQFEYVAGLKEYFSSKKEAEDFADKLAKGDV